MQCNIVNAGLLRSALVLRQSNFKYLRINARTAVNLSFKIFGDNPADADAPPIFIFHGLLGNKKHWDGIGKTIFSMTHRSVVSVDLRNHGDSPHANSHKYEDLAEDISHLLKKLDIDKVSLVGHSMGGRACMCLSLTEPQIVAGLLVLDISPVSTSKHLSEFFPKLFTAMKEINFKGQKCVRNAKQQARKLLKRVITDDVIMNAVLANIKTKSDHTIGWGCNLDVLIKHFKYIEEFPQELREYEYSGPTLFIGGQLSEYLPSAVDLAYKIHGQTTADNPVIVLHGLLGSKKNWESMCKMISSVTKSSVIGVDARNHGESPHSDSHSYLDLASDIGQLLKKLTIPKSIVLGHSMGGRTAMVFALTEPAKVSGLIVVDVSPVSTPGILNNFFPRLLDVMKSVKFDGIDNLSKARALAKDKLLASGLIEHPGTMGFIIMNVGVKPNKTIGWMCNIDVLKNQFNEIATFPNEMAGKQYNGRTLFIGGDQSNYIPSGDLTGIKQYFPQADLKYVTGAGHNVHAEDPTAFLNIVTTFLS